MVNVIKANKKDNSRRRFSGGGPRPDNNERKREEARERNAAWDGLTPRERLAALDLRFGKGVGATRQRARIKAAMAAGTKSDVPAGVNSSKGHDQQQPQREKAKDRRARERRTNA